MIIPFFEGLARSAICTIMAGAVPAKVSAEPAFAACELGRHEIVICRDPICRDPICREWCRETWFCDCDSA